MRLIKKFTIACPPLRSGHKACIIHTGYQADHTEVTLSPDAKASGLLLCASLNLIYICEAHSQDHVISIVSIVVLYWQHADIHII